MKLLLDIHASIWMVPSPEHVDDLPRLHDDSFDRLLVTQARQRGLATVTLISTSRSPTAR